MIERHWKGIAPKDRADEYITHLQNETFKQIKRIEGFVSASILKREVTEGIEFLIITQWQNIEAVRQFAGLNINVAVVPEIVQDIMVKYDDTVSHYEIYYNSTTG